MSSQRKKMAGHTKENTRPIKIKFFDRSSSLHCLIDTLLRCAGQEHNKDVKRVSKAKQNKNNKVDE